MSRKGSGNLITREMKEEIVEVFNLHGGAQGLFEWSAKSDANRKVFYLIWSKMIPKETKTEDINKTQENFVKWIQAEEEKLKLAEGKPSKILDAPAEVAENTEA